MRQIQETLLSDISGENATESVVFGWNGEVYSLDLTESEAADIRALFDGYADLGTVVGAVKSNRSDGEAAKVRQWARENGLNVGERGRIHPDILAAYNGAGGQPLPKPTPSVPKPPVKATAKPGPAKQGRKAA